jgi:hypothetical protein
LSKKEVNQVLINSEKKLAQENESTFIPGTGWVNRT